jgi:hypothetical protein
MSTNSGRTDFERNFYKASAVCPKCGLGDPKPRYVPKNYTQYFQAFDMYWQYKATLKVFSGYGKEAIDPNNISEPSADLIVPDRVDCLCCCGYQWSEKE